MLIIGWSEAEGCHIIGRGDEIIGTILFRVRGNPYQTDGWLEFHSKNFIPLLSDFFFNLEEVTHFILHFSK